MMLPVVSDDFSRLSRATAGAHSFMECSKSEK